MKNQVKTSTVVFVNPVPRAATQGRDKQAFVIQDPKSGELIPSRNMGKTKELGAATEYSFPYDPQRNRLVTGLDNTIPNPIYEMSPEEVMERYSLSFNWRDVVEKLVGQEEIKKQTWYELIDDVNPGYYTSEIAGGTTIFNMTKSTKIPEQPNYLQTFKIILYDNPNRFEDDGTKNTSRQRLAIQLIEVHNRIAKNRQEANPTKHHFYVSEMNEGEIEKQRRQDIIDEVIFAKVNLQKKAGDYKNYQVASLLTTHNGKPLIEGSATPARVKSELNNYLSEGQYQFENSDKFLKLMEYLDTKEGREKFEIMYLIQQAINTNVITIRDGYYVWNSKSSVPNMYKHSNYDKLVSLLQSEAKTWNSKEDVTNWYGELFTEVSNTKKARFE